MSVHSLITRRHKEGWFEVEPNLKKYWKTTNEEGNWASDCLSITSEILAQDSKHIYKCRIKTKDDKP